MLSGLGGATSGGDSYTGRRSIRSNSRPPGEVPWAGPPPISIYKYALRNSANLLYWDIRCCIERHTTHSLWYHLYQNWCLLFVTISYFMHVFDYDQIPLTYFIWLCLLNNELWNRASLMSSFVCLHCKNLPVFSFHHPEEWTPIHLHFASLSLHVTFWYNSPNVFTSRACNILSYEFCIFFIHDLI